MPQSLPPKISQGKRIEPPIPKRCEGSRLLILVARFSLRVPELPGSILGAAPRQGAQPESPKVEAMGGPLAAQDDTRLAAWSSGMILASGARGPGLNSRSSPSQPREQNDVRHCAVMDTSRAEPRDRILSLTIAQLSCRGCCEGQGVLTALGQAERPMLWLRAASGWPSSRAWKNRASSCISCICRR